jgi:hypothetical protein
VGEPDPGLGPRNGGRVEGRNPDQGIRRLTRPRRAWGLRGHGGKQRCTGVAFCGNHDTHGGKGDGVYELLPTKLANGEGRGQSLRVLHGVAWPSRASTAKIAPVLLIARV